MLAWICPDCGCDCSPNDQDCPDCADIVQAGMLALANAVQKQVDEFAPPAPVQELVPNAIRLPESSPPQTDIGVPVRVNGEVASVYKPGLPPASNQSIGTSFKLPVSRSVEPLSGPAPVAVEARAISIDAREEPANIPEVVVPERDSRPVGLLDQVAESSAVESLQAPSPAPSITSPPSLPIVPEFSDQVSLELPESDGIEPLELPASPPIADATEQPSEPTILKPGPPPVIESVYVEPQPFSPNDDTMAVWESSAPEPVPSSVVREEPAILQPTILMPEEPPAPRYTVEAESSKVASNDLEAVLDAPIQELVEGGIRPVEMRRVESLGVWCVDPEPGNAGIAPVMPLRGQPLVTPATVAAPPATVAPGVTQPHQRPKMPGWVISLIVATGLSLGGAIVIRNMGAEHKAEASGTAGEQSESGGSPAGSAEIAQGKFVEVSGLRVVVDLKHRSQLHYVVVNHSSTQVTNLGVRITVHSTAAGSSSKPLFTVSAVLTGLGPYASREVTTDIEDLKAADIPDWQFLKPEVQIISQ